MNKKMSKSIRKFIRLEKARIRRLPLDLAEKEKMIFELYGKFNQKTNDGSGNIQTGNK